MEINISGYTSVKWAMRILQDIKTLYEEIDIENEHST
jgi:hypothetical protein